MLMFHTYDFEAVWSVSGVNKVAFCSRIGTCMGETRSSV